MSAPASSNRALRTTAFAAVVLVPLAITGLFVSSLAGGEDALDAIPAAIVNEDKLITSTAADGTETPVFAGRLLVTELTGPDSEGFDWKITNADDAQKALDKGEVYAVLTVPSDFSESILSVSGDNPEKADITIETDDSHSYLSGTVAQVVGEGMAATFGTAITSQYLEGLYASVGTVGESLQEAADGATQISDGTTELSNGLDQLGEGATSAASGARDLAGGTIALDAGLSELSSGAASAASGARDFAGGVSDYSRGVDGVSNGLNAIASETGNLGQLSTGIEQYTAGVSQSSASLTQINAALQADPNNAEALAGLQAITDGLATAAAGGAPLAAGAAGLPDLSAGIQELAGGAAQLSAGSSELRSGATDLADGIGALAGGVAQTADGTTELSAGASELADGMEKIATGTVDSAEGSAELADGAGELANGLEEGASQVPAFDDGAAADMADVASDPVALDVSTENEVTDAGQGIATFFLPLGLWVGAFAIFLVLRPFAAGALTSTASTGRLAISRLSRASLLALGQAVVLVGLLHGALGVDWMLLPVTLLFASLMALAFTAFHFLLTVLFGRAGLVVSLFALAVQAASAGSPFPVEVLAAPFRAISPLLPLSHGISGMQAIVSGAMGADLALAVVALLAFGVGSALVAMAALSRVRRTALRTAFAG